MARNLEILETVLLEPDRSHITFLYELSSSLLSLALSLSISIYISLSIYVEPIAQSYLTLCNPMDCVAYQAPPSMGFSRQVYWSGLPFPSPMCIYIYTYIYTCIYLAAPGLSCGIRDL